MHAQEVVQKQALEIATKRFFENHVQPLRYVDILNCVQWPQTCAAIPSYKRHKAFPFDTLN